MNRTIMAAAAAALATGALAWAPTGPAQACGVTDFASCLPRQPGNAIVPGEGGVVTPEDAAGPPAPAETADAADATRPALRPRHARASRARYAESRRARREARAKAAEAAAEAREAKEARRAAKQQQTEKHAAKPADPKPTDMTALMAAGEARAKIVDPAEINELDRMADSARPQHLAQAEPVANAPTAPMPDTPAAAQPAPNATPNAVPETAPPHDSVKAAPDKSAQDKVTQDGDKASPLGKIFIAIGGILAAGSALRMFIG